MTVAPGALAYATEFNSVRSLINQWFGDPNPSMTFGDGSQTYGWGGSMPSVIIAAEVFERVDINALIDRCNIGSDIVNIISDTLPQVPVDNLVSAADLNNAENLSTLISPHRNNIEAGELSLNAGGTVVQSSTWNTLLRIVIRYTFSNFAGARYFFNSGGACNISLSLTGGTTGNALAWANLFTDIGTITMNYDDTVQSGTGGTIATAGYYDLTTGWQEYFSASPAGGSSYSYGSYGSYSPYYDNDMVINARRNAAGSWVEFQIICNDTHAGLVDGTTTLTTQFRKLINQTSGAASLSITAPTYSLQEQTSS